MAKYIDEEAIIFAYREEEVAAQYDGRNDITSGVLFVLDTISEMPESIVRCKDCIHGTAVGEDFNCRIYSEWYWFKGDHFCADGERRTSDE